jgi:hypothetical protein
MQPALYHTWPLCVLPQCKGNAFLEAQNCFNFDYLGQILNNNNVTTILDCGVGCTPDLKNPTAHTSNDPSFGVKYLSVMLAASPVVMIIPDVLGDAAATYNNYLAYRNVISCFSQLDLPEYMYVIQGQTKEEAQEQVEKVCEDRFIRWIGFPRIVHYYSAKSKSGELAHERIDFVSSVYESLKNAGKKVHLLGVNNEGELRWVAKNSASTDTRLATLGAVHNFDVLKPRPSNVNVDLCAAFSHEIQVRILDNIKRLNDYFYEHTTK